MALRRRTDSGFWRLAALAWRRKLLVAAVFVVVVGSAVAFTLYQSPLYEGSAQVVLSRQGVAAYLYGFSDTNPSQPASRYVDTQAQVARTAPVAAAVIEAAGLRGQTVDSFLRASSVKTDPNLDVLTFTVTNPSPANASRLARFYAAQFLKYQQELDLNAIASARAGITTEVDQLRAAGDTSSAAYKALLDKAQQLDVLVAVEKSRSDPVLPSTDTPQVRPRLLRNTAIAVVAAIVLALGLALFVDSLYVRG